MKVLEKIYAKKDKFFYSWQPKGVGNKYLTSSYFKNIIPKMTMYIGWPKVSEGRLNGRGLYMSGNIYDSSNYVSENQENILLEIVVFV